MGVAWSGEACARPLECVRVTWRGDEARRAHMTPGQRGRRRDRSGTASGSAEGDRRATVWSPRPRTRASFKREGRSRERKH